MASSGALTTSNQYVKYRIDVTPGNGNVPGNYTPVTVNVVVYRTNTGYTTYGTGTIWCKINGTTYSAGIASSQKITNAGIVLFSKVVNIPHNADGTKNLSVTSWLSIPGAGLSSAEQGFTFALTTIPRASTISSVTGNLMGEQITVNIKRAATNFTHQVWYKIGASEWFDLGKGHTTTCSFTVDIDQCEYIPNSTSETLSLCIRTYSGTTMIGRDYYNYDYKIYVPESVVPEISSLSITESTEGVAEKFEVFVQNISKLKVVTEATGTMGSTISSYLVEMLGNSYLGNDTITNVITDAGEVEVKVTVKDSRGRSMSIIKNIEVEEYTSPTITEFSVVRAKSDGTEDTEGEYANCDLVFDISPIQDKNENSYKIEYRRSDENTWKLIESENIYSYDGTVLSSGAVLGADDAYMVRLTVTDYFSSVTAEVNIGTGAPLMDFRYTGKGLAIGKVAEKDCLEVAMPMEVSKEFHLLRNDKRIDVFDLLPISVGSVLYTKKKYETDPSEDYPWTTWEQIKGKVLVGVDSEDTDFNEAGKTGGSKQNSHNHFTGASFDGTGFYATATSAIPRSRVRTTSRANIVVSSKGSGSTREDSTYDETINIMQPYYTMYMWLRIS